jgi:hypothetical protein
MNKALRGSIGRIATLVVTAMAASLLVAAPASAAVIIGDPTPAAARIPLSNGLTQCPADVTSRYSTVVADGDACNALGDLEQQATTNVIADRGLPNDPDLARQAARPDVNAAMWAELVDAVKKPAANRTTDQKLALEWLTQVQQRFNVQVAQAALAEYQTWNAITPDGLPGACSYTPPAPYSSEYPGAGGRWPGCYTSNGLGTIFGSTPAVPSVEQFMKWGSARIAAGLATQEVLTSLAADSAIGFSSAGLAGAAMSGATAVVALEAPQLIVALWPAGNAAAYGALAVNATAEAVAGSAEAVGVSTATAVSAALTVFTVVFIAVLTIVLKSLQLFAPDPGSALSQAVSKARTTTPNLDDLLADPNGLAQLFTLYSASLARPSSTVAVPARTQNDPNFSVNGATAAPTITARDWDGNPFTAEMRAGYFVRTTAGGARELQTWLPLVDSQGRKIHASRILKNGVWQWMSTPADGDSSVCPTLGGIATCPLTPTVTVQSPTGANEIIEFRPPTPMNLQIAVSGAGDERAPMSYSYTISSPAGAPR